MMSPQKSYQKRCDDSLNHRIKEINDVIYNFNIETVMEFVNETPKGEYVNDVIVGMIAEYVRAIFLKLKLFEVKYFHAGNLDALIEFPVQIIFSSAHCYTPPNFWNKHIRYNKFQRLVRNPLYLQTVLTELCAIVFEDEPRMITDRRKGQCMFS